MKKKMKLKPEGLVIIVLATLMLLLGIQDIVLFNRNAALQSQVAGAITNQQRECDTAAADGSEAINELQAQIEQLKAENQILMQTNIDLQSQSASQPESTETPASPQPDAQDASGLASPN